MTNSAFRSMDLCQRLSSSAIFLRNISSPFATINEMQKFISTIINEMQKFLVLKSDEMQKFDLTRIQNIDESA